MCKERQENHRPPNFTLYSRRDQQIYKYVTKQPLDKAAGESLKKQKHHQNNPWFSLWQVGISADFTVWAIVWWLQHGNCKILSQTTYLITISAFLTSYENNYIYNLHVIRGLIRGLP